MNHRTLIATSVADPLVWLAYKQYIRIGCSFRNEHVISVHSSASNKPLIEWSRPIDASWISIYDSNSKTFQAIESNSQWLMKLLLECLTQLIVGLNLNECSRFHLILISNEVDAEQVVQIISTFKLPPFIHLKLTILSLKKSVHSSTPLDSIRTIWKSSNILFELSNCIRDHLLPQLMVLAQSEFGLSLLCFKKSNEQFFFFAKFINNLRALQLLNSGNINLTVLEEIRGKVQFEDSTYETLGWLSFYPGLNWENDLAKEIVSGKRFWTRFNNDYKFIMQMDKGFMVLRWKSQDRIKDQASRILRSSFPDNLASVKVKTKLSRPSAMPDRMYQPYLVAKGECITTLKPLDGRLPDFRPSDWIQPFSDDRKTWEKDSVTDSNKKRTFDQDEIIDRQMRNNKEFLLVQNRKGEKTWIPAETKSKFIPTKKLSAAVELVEF